MLSSSVFKQTENLLEAVLRAIREEYEHPSPVLCETDRNRFVEEEEGLSKQLKEIVESESNNYGWRNLLGLSSSQAKRCLKDAEELHQRVKEDIGAKVRTRLKGEGSPPPSASHSQGSAVDMTRTRTPETDTGRPRADGHLEPASTEITSLLNMGCSPTGASGSELILYPHVAQNDNDHASSLSEAINTPLETSSNGGRNSPGRRRRRPPPPPPLQGMVQSTNSRILLETASDPGSGSPRRSHSARRPAPPPPQSPRQSRTPGSPINGSFLSPGSFPNPAMMSSISELTQQMDKLVSSVVNEGFPGQTHRRRSLRRGEEYVMKTNCVDINGSKVDGLTLNNGGRNNSGAVIHKTTLPQRVAHV